MHAAVTSAEGGYVMDQRYIRRDGSMFPVEVILSPLLVEGNVRGAVQSFRDVSEREMGVVLHREPIDRGRTIMLRRPPLGPDSRDQTCRRAARTVLTISGRSRIQAAGSIRIGV